VCCTVVLIFVNSAWYLEGHRLYERPEWAEWKLRYEAGEYDDELRDPDEKKPSVMSDEPPRISIGSQRGDGTVSLISPAEILHNLAVE
jgi:hypothetical protein